MVVFGEFQSHPIPVMAGVSRMFICRLVDGQVARHIHFCAANSL